MASGVSSTHDLYQEHILEHFESPYHKGQLEQATCCHHDRNPLCGDQIEMMLKVEDDKVAVAYFDGRGCAISQAAASILCEAVEGKPVAEVRDMQAQDMLDLLKVPLTASRQKCGLLAFKVLKTMLYAQDSDSPTPIVS